MKNIDYTGLRRLAKYDIGTQPIGSGYQRNADQTQAGYFTQNVTPVTNAFVPQAISQGLSTAAQPLMNIAQNTAKYITAYNNAAKTIGTQYGKLAAQQTGEAAERSVYQEGLQAAKEGAKSAASKVAGAASTALNVYGALHGGYGLYQNTKDSDTLTAGDLSTMASRSTEYTNGVAYERMGGYDASGVNKYVEDQNKANKIGGITSGLEAGAGIGGLVGSIFPGAGTLIGSGIGALLGAIGGGMFGHSAREKRKRAIEEAKRNYALAADAYNTQNESEAASTGLRNDFYATHGDEGLGLDNKNPNALIQGGEPIVRVKKDRFGNNRIVAAGMFPITPETPERVDNIPVRLDKGDAKHGVIGNLIDPNTGERLAKEARVDLAMFNSGDPYLQNIGEQGLLDKLDMQDALQKEQKDMKKYACGKGLRKYAIGKNLDGAFIPTMAFTANELDNWAHGKEIDRMPIEAYNAYSPNPYLMQAGALMPTIYNIDPQMQALNDEARFANYAINQSAYSPGQRMAMLSNLYNKKMQNVTKLLGEKANQENTMRANYAKWLSDVGAQEQQLASAYRQKYYDQLAQANARKFNAIEQIHKDKRQNWSDLAQNLYNIYMGNKNIGLYEQKLSNEKAATLEQIQKQIDDALKAKSAIGTNTNKSTPVDFDGYSIWTPSMFGPKTRFNIDPLLTFKYGRG